jgi:glycerol-3-phosphate acyltransferase PlsY
MAVLGHNFPWSLGFRGGKGVATTIGTLLGADPAIAGLAGAIWAFAAAASRHVSVASMAAAIGIPLGQWWLGRAPEECAVGAALGGLLVIRHQDNSVRV